MTRVAMDASERELIAATFRELLFRTPPDRLLAELQANGWHELLDGDEESAVGLLFREQGRALAAGPALDVVVARAAGVELTAGAGLVHCGSGASGLVLAGAGTERLVVPGPDGARVQDAGSVHFEAVAGLDPTLGLRRVDVAADPSSAVRAAARRALAHELLGVTESMLELTVTHVTGRIQYGRAIGAFQAVQHRMADVQVALDAARAVTSAAWRNGDSLTCDAAKALAGRAALLASKHCQQVVGAIGFTAEHPLPRHISRAHVLDALYGSASAIQERIGEQLLDHRAAFRLPPAWAGD